MHYRLQRKLPGVALPGDLVRFQANVIFDGDAQAMRYKKTALKPVEVCKDLKWSLSRVSLGTAYFYLEEGLKRNT